MKFKKVATAFFYLLIIVFVLITFLILATFIYHKYYSIPCIYPSSGMLQVITQTDCSELVPVIYNCLILLAVVLVARALFIK